MIVEESLKKHAQDILDSDMTLKEKLKYLDVIEEYLLNNQKLNNEIIKLQNNTKMIEVNSQWEKVANQWKHNYWMMFAAFMFSLISSIILMIFR